MKAALRLPVPMVVAGVALVVCGLRAGHPADTAEAASPLAYAPPASAPAVLQHVVHVTGGAPRRAHTASRSAKSAPERPVHHAAAPTPSAAAAPVSTHSPKPAPEPQPTHATTAFVSGPTHWSALNAAIARIPTYRSGASHWVVSSKYDFWGTADWYHDVLYVDPSVPTDKLYDVAVHEWSHELSVLDYSGDVATATRAMNQTFGGSGLTGPERAADCMAILQGAGWTHYTTCTNQAWRAAAARLVAGKTL